MFATARRNGTCRAGFRGWGDSPLTTRGVAQAEAIGKRLARIPETVGVSVVSSPLGRARRTAELIQVARGDNAPVELDDRLKEISLGSWDGLDRAEIDARSPGIFQRHGQEWYFNSPDGETYDAFAGRLGAWLSERGEGAVITVAHGVVSRVMRGLYAELPRREALSLPVPQDMIWRLAGGRVEEIAV